MEARGLPWNVREVHRSGWKSMHGKEGRHEARAAKARVHVLLLPVFVFRALLSAVNCQESIKAACYR